MLRCLKEGGVVLHQQMPYQYLPYVVEIISYSFTDSQESFDNFLNVIKENCSELFEPLRTSNFQGLLMALVAVTKNREDGFFKSLD
jgi:hypothetical protein